MGAFCGKTSEQVVADAVATLNDEKAFSGKVAIVTGPLAGIGRYTCFTLAGLGVKVVLAGRQKKRLEALASEIRAQHPQANVYPLELDLSSLASVRQFAEEFKALDLPLHYLINNAAVMACPYTVSSDGYELQYATNFLGHFLLTELLIPVLKKNAPARIVNVSSRGHLFAKANAEQPEIRKQDYNPWVSYGNSKLYNIWHASELNRRLQGTNVTAYSLHPGSIPTELGRHNLIAHVAYSIAGKCMKSISQGASTTLYCTLSPDVELLAGGYFADCKAATPSETALNVKNAETLYNGSLALLGIKSSI